MLTESNNYRLEIEQPSNYRRKENIHWGTDLEGKHYFHLKYQSLCWCHFKDL